MRDRKGDHNDFAVLGSRRQEDRAGTILFAFFLTTLRLFTPKVRIADDETRLRLRERHSNLFHFSVKVGRSTRRLRGANGLKIGFGEVVEAKHLAVAAL